MSVTVTLNASNAKELKQTIQDLAAVWAPQPPQAVPTTQETSPEVASKVEGKPAETKPIPASTEDVETPPAVSKETVRAKLAALVQDDKQDAVKELFAKFGAERLSDVPEEQYGKLLKAAEEIA